MSRTQKRMAMACLLALLLSACGGGSNSPDAPSPNPPTNPPANPPQQTVPGLIAELERTGVLPVLDRSTSLRGPDADNDGVRDDIEAYIDALPDTAVQKKSLRQTSKALSQAFAASERPPGAAEIRAAGTAISLAVQCIWRQYDADVASAKTASMRKFTTNTRQRFDAYVKFNTLMSGAAARLSGGDTCENL